VDWIHLALGREKLRLFVKVDRIPYNGGNLLNT
jgi:hypothetical protein